MERKQKIVSRADGIAGGQSVEIYGHMAIPLLLPKYLVYL
jgi:hypothetical protein